MRYLAYAPELKLEFANRGVSGSTSRGVLQRWDKDGVHPSYAGHMHMADFWLKSVADFMKAKNTAAAPAP